MRFLRLLICALGLLVGCSHSVAPLAGGPTSSSGAKAAPSAQPKVALDTVNLVLGDEKKLAEILARHKGDVVFVDYWALWCHSCVEYFPHTVEMSGKYKSQGLATVAISFDPTDKEPDVRKYLAEQGADFENLISTYEQGPAAFEGFSIDLVPHFRLYDRAGKLRYKWDDKPQDADEKIEQLLAETAESAGGAPN